jgi:hypothetical protein
VIDDVNNKNKKLKKVETMQKNQITSDGTSNMFLTGTILLANMDYSGLADYAVKALVGGLIWMTFKIAGDFITEKMKKK